ncbi:replicative DNA helicase [Myxococcota bacterium]|nr:replicative DNA helicase [Myxococcota bacterium]
MTPPSTRPHGSSGEFSATSGGRRRSRRNATDGNSDPARAFVGRVPPHDLEAEKSVLSGLLLHNESIHAVYLEVKPEDFYHPAHSIVFAAMHALYESNSPIDLRTLSDYLVSHKLLDRVGGAVVLAEISDYETTAAHVVHHARIVRDKGIKRRLIATATEIVELGFDGADRADLLLDQAEGRILEIGRQNARETFRSLQDEMQSTFDYVEAIMGRGGELTGVPTGFKQLDEKTGGLQPGELFILAARPSMGKTALALNIARNSAVLYRKKIAIFSLEMTAQALVLRLLSAEAEVDQSRIRSGYLSTHDYKRLRDAASAIGHADLWIDDSGMITVLEMKAKCRRMKKERGLDMVMVDYLQLAHGDGRNERREQEISEISRGLKAMAKELEIPVVALSQLNRGPENRPGTNKRPMLADLRESGAIEQDADVIAFIYRDWFYNRDDPATENLAELIIAKQRNGPTGTIELTFLDRLAQFRDRSAHQDDGVAGPPRGGSGFLPPDDDPESGDFL